MRTIPGLLLLLLTAFPAISNSQSLELYGAGGPTITDAGNSWRF
jgi:accessory colonization factor AcfC